MFCVLISPLFVNNINAFCLTVFFLYFISYSSIISVLVLNGKRSQTSCLQPANCSYFICKASKYFQWLSNDIIILKDLLVVVHQPINEFPYLWDKWDLFCFLQWRWIFFVLFVFWGLIMNIKFTMLMFSLHFVLRLFFPGCWTLSFPGPANILFCVTTLLYFQSR